LILLHHEFAYALLSISFVHDFFMLESYKASRETLFCILKPFTTP